MNEADRQALVRRLMEDYGERAQREVKSLLMPAAPSDDFVHEHLKEYILAKLLLAENEDSDDLSDLIDKSIQRMSRLGHNLIDEMKTAKTCNDLSSASVKKVMLLYRLRRDLEISVPAVTLTGCASVADLSCVVASALRSRGSESPAAAEKTGPGNEA